MMRLTWHPRTGGGIALALACVCTGAHGQDAVPPPRAPASAASQASAEHPSAAALAGLSQLTALPAPTLPKTPLLDALLAETPRLREAEALKRAAEQNGAVLIAGTQEFTGQAQVQQRRIGAPPDQGNYTEWQLLLSRPIRLPSQQRADIRMAGALSTSADAGIKDARQVLLEHALSMWFRAQLTQAEVILAQHNLTLLEAQVQALKRRTALGDASLLDLEQLQAEAARAQSALLLAQGAANSTRAELLTRYPALAPDATLVGQPGSTARLGFPELAVGALRDKVEHNSAILAQARANFQQAEAAAAQAHAARIPQPTVGAYVGSDRGGRERIVGLQFSMPFGGKARVARERSALAELDAAQWRLQDAQARTLAAFGRLYALARSQADAAQALQRASQVQDQATARMFRAYQLGEAGISEWLVARRNALDVIRQALQARFDAAQSNALLKLQAGLLLDSAYGAARLPPENAAPMEAPQPQSAPGASLNHAAAGASMTP